MPIIRASDVLIKAGITIPTVPIITDHIIRTTCPDCKDSQTLNQCSIHEDAGNTYYQCKNGCQPILIIGKVGQRFPVSSAYRLKDHVINNKSDLFIDLPNGTSILLPLDKSR